MRAEQHFNTLGCRRSLIRVALGAVGVCAFLGAPAAHAGESYPIDAASHAIDPVVCASGFITGFADGAEPGTTVTFTVVVTLADGTTTTTTLTATVDSTGRASYSTAIPNKSKSAKITAVGETIETLEPFAISATTDLSKCFPTGTSGGGGLVETGADSKPWLQIGAALTAGGTLLVISGVRWQRSRKGLAVAP
jgi:hypothetical protein